MRYLKYLVFVSFFVPTFALADNAVFYATSAGQTQSVTANVSTALTLWKSVIDNTGSYSNGSSGYSVPISGYYHVVAQVECASSGVGYCYASIATSTTIVASTYSYMSSSDNNNPIADFTGFLNAGDAVRIYATTPGTTIGGSGIYTHWFIEFLPTSSLGTSSLLGVGGSISRTNVPTGLSSAFATVLLSWMKSLGIVLFVFIVVIAGVYSVRLILPTV